MNGLVQVERHEIDPKTLHTGITYAYILTLTLALIPILILCRTQTSDARLHIPHII